MEVSAVMSTKYPQIRTKKGKKQFLKETLFEKRFFYVFLKFKFQRVSQ
jgi:hypothetical protein